MLERRGSSRPSRTRSRSPVASRSRAARGRSRSQGGRARGCPGSVSGPWASRSHRLRHARRARAPAGAVATERDGLAAGAGDRKGPISGASGRMANGDNGFIPAAIGFAREKGAVAYVGDGANRWPAVRPRRRRPPVPSRAGIRAGRVSAARGRRRRRADPQGRRELRRAPQRACGLRHPGGGRRICRLAQPLLGHRWPRFGADHPRSARLAADSSRDWSPTSKRGTTCLVIRHLAGT